MNNNKNSNLKPWKPGQSGNPTGRKVGSKNISTIVRELLEQDADERLLVSSHIADLTRGKPTCNAQAIALAMLKKALEGNVQAVCWLADQQARNYAYEREDSSLFSTSKLTVEVVRSNQSTVD
jgi:hypothetical protein